MDSSMTADAGPTATDFANDIETLKQEAMNANAHFESIRKASYAQGIHDSLNLARGEQNQPENIGRYLLGNIVDSFKEMFKQDTMAIRAQDNIQQFEVARKAGYVQGVCECVAAIGDDHFLGKKLLSEMNVTREAAKKYANPETFKALEQGIFALPKQEQTLDRQQQTQGRRM